METRYEYHATATWTEHRRGLVETESIARTINFSAPPEFGGEPGLWTPEHLLVAAVSTCFVSTFRAVAELSKVEVTSMRVAVEGILEKTDGGFRFTKLIVRPTVEIPAAQDTERIIRLLHKAERSCLVSRSLNSEVALEPIVMAGSLTAVG
jgi:peroxiredoxin-like protein